MLSMICLSARTDSISTLSHNPQNAVLVERPHCAHKRTDRCRDFSPRRSQGKLKLTLAGKSRHCLSASTQASISKSVMKFKCVVQSGFAPTAGAKKTVSKEKRAHLFTNRFGDCHGA
jgi:hypothetical protein